MKILTELHYLPGIEYFVNLLIAEEIIIEACENFQKQTYRNRCNILGANKIERLVIPVKHNINKILIRDVHIDYTQRWSSVHWRAICSAYGKSPFFDYYVLDFENVFNKKHKFLFDFNLDLLTLCLKILKLNKKINFTTTYQSDDYNGQIDLRDTIKAKGNAINSPYFKAFPYIQNFGKHFVSGLSIIDLLFCEGNYAIDILKQSLHSNEQNSDFHC